MLVVDVELVVDVADDLLDGVLDRDETGDPAVFVDDDRHVVAVAAEFLEKHVDALGFRHDHRRSHALADVEAVFLALCEHAQHVLGEQDADDVVAVGVHQREPGMPGLDDDRQEPGRRLVAAHRDHLRARHHDVADLDVGHAEHTLEHVERLAVDQAALAGLPELLDQFLTVLGLARQRPAQFADPPRRGAPRSLVHAASLRGARRRRVAATGPAETR